MKATITVGELRETLKDFPDDQRVEIMVGQNNTHHSIFLNLEKNDYGRVAIKSPHSNWVRVFSSMPKYENESCIVIKRKNK